MQPFDDLCSKELARALLESEGFCCAVLGVCGIDVTAVGERFFNPYQPHEDKPSAYLYRTSDGRLEVRSFREVEGERKGSRATLAQLYRDTRAGVIAAIREGATEINRRTVGGPESAVWIVRLAHETGFIQLPPSQAQPLTQGATDSHRLVHEGADLLNRCRRRYNFDNASFPAAARFIMDWTGQGESEVASAKRWLVTGGYWIVVSKGQPYQKGQHAQPTLYRFGKPEEISVRERAAMQKHAETDIDRRYQSSQQAAQELREGRSNPAGHLPQSYEEWQRQQAGGDLHVQQEG